MDDGVSLRASPLFEPARIGDLQLPNRIVKSAMGEGLCDERGHGSQALAKRYERWSAGGVGLAITGMAYVLPEHSVTGREIGLYDDSCIEPLRGVVEAAHRGDGKIFVQLNHPPPQQLRARLKRLGPVAMSPGFNPTALLRNRAATDRELRAIARAFGSAASRARQAGADGVQLHAAHGYLLSRSLSARHNRRRDRWGGSFARRLTLLRQVYQAVRSEVGAGYPVAVKLNAHDGEPGGLDLSESTLIARELESWGVDAIEVSAGTADVGKGFYPNRGDIPVDLAQRFLLSEFPWLRAIAPIVGAVIAKQQKVVAFDGEPYFAREAAHIARAVRIPVIAVGGIRSAERAEHLLRETPIALIAMARPLIRQPALVDQWRAGRHLSARCVSCNRCFVSLSFGEPLRCRATA
jgi:2,4-dienoyl-CoA reductase-like NADH-dependent reductase (Old Yellow Enzyme family)